MSVTSAEILPRDYYSDNLDFAVVAAMAMDPFMTGAKDARAVAEFERAEQLSVLADTAGRLAVAAYIDDRTSVANTALELGLGSLDRAAIVELSTKRVYRDEMDAFVAQNLTMYRTTRARGDKAVRTQAKRYVTRLFRNIAEQQPGAFEIQEGTGKSYTAARRLRTGEIKNYDGLELEVLVEYATYAENRLLKNPSGTDTEDLMLVDFTRHTLTQRLGTLASAIALPSSVTSGSL